VKAAFSPCRQQIRISSRLNERSRREVPAKSFELTTRLLRYFLSLAHVWVRVSMFLCEGCGFSLPQFGTACGAAVVGAAEARFWGLCLSKTMTQFGGCLVSHSSHFWIPRLLRPRHPTSRRAFASRSDAIG
jgi:hypothetical protein